MNHFLMAGSLQWRVAPQEGAVKGKATRCAFLFVSVRLIGAWASYDWLGAKHFKPLLLILLLFSEQLSTPCASEYSRGISMGWDCLPL